MDVRLFFDQIALFLKFRHYGLPRLKAVHPLIMQTILIEGAIRVEDIDQFKVVLPPDFIIVLVMGRGDFQATRSEIHSHIFVPDHRYHPVTDGYPDIFSVQMTKTFIMGVNTYSRIPQQGFRPGRGNHHRGVRPLHGIGDMVEVPLAFLVLYLLIRQGGASFRIPVNHPVAPVNKPFPIKIHKNPDHGFLHIGIHGKLGALPVTGTAQLF